MRSRGDRARRSRGVTLVGLATTVLATTVVVAAFFGNELRAQDYDPQFMKVLIDRVGAVGVTYYEGALHNKGPFEPFVYRAASFLTSDDGYWFAISAFVLVAAALSAGAVTSTARAAGTSRLVAAAVGGGLFVHLTLTPADYSGVLYSRNITTAVLATAWMLALASWPWTASVGRRLGAAGAVGVLLGLCVQTLVTAVFAAAVVAAVTLLRIRREHRAEWRRATAVLVGCGAATVLAPFVWYALRGKFAEFWGGWWIYGRYQSSGLGRSLFGQFGLAWDEAYSYYRAWPLSALTLVAGRGPGRRPLAPAAARPTGAAGRRRSLDRRRLDRLALAQRYSSHYFSILALPTWLAAATAVADTIALAPARRIRPSVRARSRPWSSSPSCSRG